MIARSIIVTLLSTCALVNAVALPEPQFIPVGKHNPRPSYCNAIGNCKSNKSCSDEQLKICRSALCRPNLATCDSSPGHAESCGIALTDCHEINVQVTTTEEICNDRLAEHVIKSRVRSIECKDCVTWTETQPTSQFGVPLGTCAVNDDAWENYLEIYDESKIRFFHSFGSKATMNTLRSKKYYNQAKANGGSI
ncbi:hypothetical protein FQN49_007308 [Arthroderma sp. PD_2]|nr:hypothetical protein FQN49_007308 [Arthroderma sp. PD_2]